MKWIKKNTRNLIKDWDSFWFKPMSTLPVSCFRFCFCSILLAMYLIRFFDIRIFFYESGLLSSTSAKAFHQMYTNKSFHFILSSDTLLYLCYILFIIILFLMVLGVANRFIAVLAFVLHLVFLQRNPSITFGADIIATFWLFYLIFSNSNKEIKWVHYLLKKQKGLMSERLEKGDWLNTIAIRLIQIQLCVIYMFSGMEKLKGKSWWDGTAIWEALSFYDFTFFNFSFLLSAPMLSAVLVIFTVLFEIYFPVLVWVPRLRKPVLLAGFFPSFRYCSLFEYLFLFFYYTILLYLFHSSRVH